MRPRLIASEIVNGGGLQLGSPVASMRPRLIASEINTKTCIQYSRVEASMRPRLIASEIVTFCAALAPRGWLQ